MVGLEGRFCSKLNNKTLHMHVLERAICDQTNIICWDSNKKIYNDKSNVVANRSKSSNLERQIGTVGSAMPLSRASFKLCHCLALSAWSASILSTHFLAGPFFSFCIRLCACSSVNWCFLLNALIVFSVKASKSAYIRPCVWFIVTHRHTDKEWRGGEREREREREAKQNRQQE